MLQTSSEGVPTQSSLFLATGAHIVQSFYDKIGGNLEQTAKVFKLYFFGSLIHFELTKESLPKFA